MSKVRGSDCSTKVASDRGTVLRLHAPEARADWRLLIQGLPKPLTPLDLNQI